MSKKNENDLPRLCLYCEKATPLIGGETVLCSYNGVVEQDHKCSRFTYDPLKRKPLSRPEMPTLSKEDIL